ncbi:hypothetical protein [Catelliglobosispora koreensis]|uniref:hypothetical protein n=1 Tax=Catelliglobosispora koreensis TaxID=129052 RepID=UPI000372D259|nr:hypothetical protein [Catelliglobosispora koreensis]
MDLDTANFRSVCSKTGLRTDQIEHLVRTISTYREQDPQSSFSGKATFFDDELNLFISADDESFADHKILFSLPSSTLTVSWRRQVAAIDTWINAICMIFPHGERRRYQEEWRAELCCCREAGASWLGQVRYVLGLALFAPGTAFQVRFKRRRAVD